MIKRSVQEEDTTIINVYAPNLGAPQIGKANTKNHNGRDPDSNTVIVGDFNTPLSSMDRSSWQKINKETQVLNDTLDQLYLIDIYGAVHPKATEYTLFSSIHRTFSRIDHMLGHRQALVNLRKLISYQASFPITMLWE